MRRLGSFLIDSFNTTGLDASSFDSAFLGEIGVQRNHHIAILESVLLLGVNQLGRDRGADDGLNLVGVDDASDVSRANDVTRQVVARLA